MRYTEAQIVWAAAAQVLSRGYTIRWVASIQHAEEKLSE
jgi:hypothetical protein